MPSMKLYNERIAAGVCVACGKLPPEQGQRRCASCRDAYRQYQRAYHGSQPKRPGGPGHPLAPTTTPPLEGRITWPRWIERGRERYGLDRKEDRRA